MFQVGNSLLAILLFTGWLVDMSKNGLVLVKPSSVVVTGTATITTNGSVDFSCTSLLLNGVFSSTYDNYMMVISGHTASQGGFEGTFSSGGVPETVAKMRNAYLVSSSTGALPSIQSGPLVQVYIAANWGTKTAGSVSHIYAPYLAKNTMVMSSDVSSYSGGDVPRYLEVSNLTENHPVQYDGLKLDSLATCSGRVAIYGVRK
jgi:hypothetical protein